MIPPFALDAIAFCALGVLSETQRIAHVAAEDMADADREKVFAETLCLVATTTSRAAASVVPSGDPATSDLVQVLLALPLTMHSYVVGAELLSSGADQAATPAHDRSDLERMLTFYTTQLAETGYPGRKALRHAMILWMGRISPSGLAEHPERRLERLHLVDHLGDHLRLTEAYVRKAAASAG